MNDPRQHNIYSRAGWCDSGWCKADAQQSLAATESLAGDLSKERAFVCSSPAGLCARHRGAVTTAAIIFRSLRVAPLVDIHWCLSEAFRSACTSLWLPSRLFSEADHVWQSICYRPSVAMKGDGHVSSRVVCCYRTPQPSQECNPSMVQPRTGDL